MDKPPQMNARGDGPTRSNSDQIAYHAEHNICSRDPLPQETPRTVPGNAWCYTCHVPINGNWSENYGIRKIGEEPKQQLQFSVLLSPAVRVWPRVSPSPNQ